MTSIIAMSTILRGTAPSRTRTLMNTISSATAMCTFRTFIIGTVTDGLRALAIASFAAAACAAPYVPKDAATREDPKNARALSWRAAIHMVQADYARAREDCFALQKVESELYAVGCTAYLDGTTGKAAAAHRNLSAAFAGNADAPPEVKVW